MAVPIGSLFVSLTADVQPFAQAMTRAQSVTGGVTRNIARNAGVGEKAVDRFWQSSAARNFRPYSLIAVSRAFEGAADRASLLRGSLLATTGVFTGFIGALSTNLIIRYADTYTNLSNQIRVVSSNAADLAARLEAVQTVAQRSRAGLESTAILYSRIQKASPDRGAEEVLRYVETIQKALQLGGATIQESRSAAIQFSQAIASNRLGGEELRAVLETPLGLELARGIGVTLGEFRKMGLEGKLTADVVLGALSKVAGSIDQQFSRSIMTVDQALTQVDNQLTAFFGNVNQTYGATRLLATGILSIGNNLDTLLPLIAQVGGGLAAAFIGKKLAGAGTGIVRAIKADAVEARERVVSLKDQIRVLSTASADSAAKSATFAKALRSGDVAEFADQSAVKAVQRADQQINKAREAAQKAFNELRAGQRELASIGPNVSARAIKFADDLAGAEDRVNTGLTRQAKLVRDLAAARNHETASLGLQTTTGRLQSTGEATKARISIERELANAEKGIARDREVIVRRQVDIDNLQATAEKAAVDKRLEQARRVNTLRSTYQQSRLNVGLAGLDARSAQEAVTDSGTRNARTALTGQVADVSKLNAAIKPLTTNLLAAESAATQFGRAKAFVNRQSLALLGTLGGPWGVAITGAIVLMGALAAKSARAAQEIASAQKTIEQRLQKINAAGGKEQAGAGDSLLDARVKKTKSDIESIEKEYDRVLKIISDARVIQRAGTSGSDRQIVAAQNEVIELVRQYAQGSITVDDFNERLSKIQTAKPYINSLAEAARENAGALRGAAVAAKDYRAELDLLASGKLTAAQREGLSKLSGDGGERFRSTYDASESDKFKEAKSPLLARREIIDVQDLLRLRDQAYEVEKRYQDLKKQYPLLADEEVRANAAIIVGLDKAKKNYEEAEKAANSLAMELAKEETESASKKFTSDSDILQSYDIEASGIRARMEAREVEHTALVKYLQAQKNGTNLTYEVILQREKEQATLRQVASAYDEIESAAAAAALEEERAAGAAATAFGDFYSNIHNRIQQKLLKAQGKDIEARAQEIYFEGLKQNIPISYDVARSLAIQEDRADKLARAHERGRRAAEAFAERLARLKETAQGAFLGDIDRAVLEHGRAMKASADDLAAYVAAAKSGNFSGVSSKLIELRDIELLVKAGGEYRNIVQQYGTWEQIVPLVAEKQQQLNLAVQNGSITAGQAKLAYADFLASFQNYKWIDTTSDAIGNFADEAIADFDNVGVAAQNLAKTLAKIAYQEAFTNPLRNIVKGFLGQAGGGDLFSGLSGLFGGGGGGGGLGLSLTTTGGLYHSGGRVGDAAPMRTVSSFAGAPRLHSGLTSKEYKAILERGEHVLTEKMADRTGNVISGLSERVGRGAVQIMAPVQINLPSGANKTDIAQAQLVGNEAAKAMKNIAMQVFYDESRPGGMFNK
jgi:tape measure domain-containing protein